jgi:glycosyltransferase involved in cell wall biosynthesis
MERLKDIYELLDSIKVQTYPNIEVVFVAERSEELRQKVKRYGNEIGLSKFKVLFNDGEPGQSVARNLGLTNAEGDIIGFVDDDVVLFPKWAEETVKSYKSDSIIGVTGPAFPLWENESMSWLPEEFYWIISCTAFLGWNELRPVRCAGGMNMSFRKEAFESLRFSEYFGHIAQERRKVGPVVDDAEFSIRIRLKTGKSILFNPQVQVRHRAYFYRIGNRFVRGQAYWQGYSKALLKKTYPEDPDTNALTREYDLLRRIFFGLIPRTIKQFFTSPGLAWKTSTLTTNVIFYTALGYSASAFPRIAGFTKRYFSA